MPRSNYSLQSSEHELESYRNSKYVLFNKRSHSNRSKEDTMLIEFTMVQEWSIKDVIFLPFNPLIIYGFLAINILSTHIYLYLLGYDSKYGGIVEIIIHFLEINYAIHTGLIILHRCLSGHRKKRVHKPVHILVVFLDIITVLPIKQWYSLLQRFNWYSSEHTKSLDFYLYSIKTLRIFRLYTFYKEYNSDPGLNKKIILPLFHFILSTTVAQMMGLIYYHIACYRCTIVNWTNNLENFEIDKEDNINWMIICYCYTFSIQINNSMGFINNRTMEDMVLAMVSMLIGFMMQFMYFTGSLMSEYIQQMKYKFAIEKHLEKVKNFMKLLNMPERLQSDVKMHYEILWSVRKGVVDMPKIFLMCPPSLQTEITTDIYWEAIMHSNIFSSFDDAFKRELSTCMKSEIFRAGEFLLKRGEMKYKMMYLVSGQIEIMSAENRKSSILSLSTGTVLGETACFMPTRSTANIRCSTVCEIHTMDCVAFGKLMTKYKKSYAIRRSIGSRILYAKFKLNQLKKANIKTNHIYWIKNQWRNLIKLRTNPSLRDSIRNVHFTSLFLDMLVLSSHEEVKVNSICIRGKCSFIMDANSTFRHFIHYVCMASVILQFFTTAYMIAFIGEINKVWYMFLTVLDVVYFVDIYMQSITAVMVHNVLVTKPGEVLLIRSKQITYMVDIIASIPFDWLGYLGGTSDYVICLLRIPKFLKLYKVLLFFFEKQNTLTSYVINIQVAKFFSLHSIALMVLVCAMYMTNCIHGECQETGWLTANKGESNYHFDKSLETFYHTTSLYFGMGTTKYLPGNMYDIIMYHVIILIGYYMNAFFFVQFCAAWGLQNESTYYHKLKISQMEMFLRDRRQLKHLKQNIIEQCKLNWIVNGDLQLEGVWNIIDQNSQYIKSKVQRKFVLNILKQTKLFRSCTGRFLELLINEMRLFTIPPGHVIVDTDQRVFHLYIILKGCCQFRSYVPGDAEKNQESYHSTNTVFPIIEFVHQVNSFLRVKSETVVQLLGIPYVKFSKLLKVFPEEFAVFETVIKDHNAQYHTMLQRIVVSHLRSKQSTVVGIKVSTFSYNIDEPNASLRINSSRLSHSLMERWRHLLTFVVHTTYNPTGKFFMIYELVHMCIVLFRLTVIAFTTASSFSGQTFMTVWMWSTRMIWFIDLYVRSHVQYYNDIGIKVTHPLYTFKHYMNTQFMVDLIADLPFAELKLNQLLTPTETVQTYYFMLLCLRPLMLYRPYLFLNYIENNVFRRYAITIKMIKFTVIIIPVTDVLCLMRLVLSCPLAEGLTIRHVCPANSWLERDLAELSPFHFLLKNFYATLSLTIVNGYTMRISRDFATALVMSTVVLIAKILFHSYVIGCNVFQNLKLGRYQDGIKHYKLFTNRKVLSNADKTEILEHYINLWKKSNGEVPSKLFKSCYPLLMEDIFMALYVDELGKCPLFGQNDTNFFRLLVPYLEERHFKKDAQIIRCNDVQDELFFVYKGNVAVQVAAIRTAILHPGSMFGCFASSGITRQTINVTAMVHVCVLVIKTKLFYSILHHFPDISSRFKTVKKKNDEYVTYDVMDLGSFSMKSVTRFTGRFTFFLRTYRDTNQFILIWEYITNMHVVPLSVILCLLVAVVMEHDTMIQIWIPLDIYFLINEYISIHIRYTDLESGITITSLNLLMKRYGMSLKCYVSIISILPFYFLHHFSFRNTHRSGYYIMNKLVRLLFMTDYYSVFANKRNVPRHLRWVFLTYISLIVIQIVFCLWFIVRVVRHEQSLIWNIVSTYMHVVNILTTTKIPEAEVNDYRALLVNGIVVVTTQCLIIYMLVIFSKMLLLQNTYPSKYKIDAELFRIYCSKQQISPPIIKKSWAYLMYLFRTQRGEQIPALLANAPPYIKQDHFETLYRGYLETHYLFVNAHVDFVRQLYMYLQMSVYLPEDNIVEYGDRNGTMFFIENGNVASMDGRPENLFEIENLEKNEWFGELQGLSHIPHTKTYKAVTVCHIVSLRKQDWGHLLDWFPATRETMLQMARIYFNAPKDFYI